MRIDLTIKMAMLGLVGATLVEHVAFADAKSDAQALLDQGNDEVGHGDYLHALEKFQAAYAVFPSPKILLNVGTTLRQLGRNAEALDAYDKYLAANDVDESKKPEVREIEGTLAPKVGVLHVDIVDQRPSGSVAITRVDVDAKSVGGGAKAFDLRVDQGPHSVVVTIGQGDSAKTLAEDTTVVGGGAATAHFVLHPDPIVGDGGAADRADADRRRARTVRRTVGIVAISVGAAGAALAVVTGVLILHDRSVVSKDCPASLKGLCNAEAGLSAAKQGKALIPINAIGWGLGIAGVGVGIPLIVSGIDSGSTQPKAALTVGPASLMFEGTY